MMERELLIELATIVKELCPPDSRQRCLDVLAALEQRRSLAMIRRDRREAEHEASHLKMSVADYIEFRDSGR